MIPVGPVIFFHREADRDGGAVADRLFRVFKHFADQARPVLHAAAILVGPAVDHRREEMLRDAEAVRDIDINDVEADIDGSFGRFGLPPAHVLDIRLVHAVCDHRIPIVMGDVGRRRKRNCAAAAVGKGKTPMHEFYSRQRIATMAGPREQRQIPCIALVPQALLSIGSGFG